MAIVERATERIASDQVAIVESVDPLPIDQILGPGGALVLAVICIAGLIRALWILWREHLKADADDRAQRDKAFDLAAVATDSTKRLADALEERNRRDRERGRRDDG